MSEEFFKIENCTGPPPCEMILRVDERLKATTDKLSEINAKLTSLSENMHSLAEKLAVINSHDVEQEVVECSKAIVELDKRIATLEEDSGRGKDRWNRISNFIIQLAWVVLAAWLLAKLNLPLPDLPI